MSVVPEELREELRREREVAKNVSDEGIEQDVDVQEAEKETAKCPWQPKKIDLIDDLKNQLYGTSSKDESKVSISLDQIDDDDDMLRYMETVPAIKRN